MEILEASFKGDLLRVKQLLEEGVNVNAKNINGWSALMYAADNGHVEVVRTLLEAGADVAAKPPIGWTALMFAVYNDDVEMVRILLAAGADITPDELRLMSLEHRWELQSLWSWNKRKSMVNLRNYLLNLDD